MSRRGAATGRQRVLVVAAHPDDEVLGCGGTMARHADRGDHIHLVIVGEGITSRASRRDRRADDVALRALRRDVATAARIIGISKVSTHAFPDNRFDTVPLLDLIKIVEREKSVARPTIVYTHHPNDLNIDHRCVADAVQTAFRPLPGEPAVTILAFEVASSTEYQSPLKPGVFQPTVYVDIAATLERKCEGMNAYRGERRQYPHPRSAEALRVIAQRNGLEVGVAAAERFALVRTVVQGDR